MSGEIAKDVTKKRSAIEAFAFDDVSSATEKRLQKALFDKKRALDVSVHARKAAWVAAYGSARIALCILCQFNEVGWTNVGFDLAHVVARCCDGNNTELWNRVPVCSTCNQNVSSETNLLDFAAEHYPARVVPLTIYLFEQFGARQPHLAQEAFESNQIEPFARFLYGSLANNINLSTKNAENALSLRLFRKRSLQHTERGAIQNESVYAILRAYDGSVHEAARATARMDRLQSDMDALQRVQQTLLADWDAAKSAKEKAEQQIMFYTTDHNSSTKLQKE